MSAKVVVETAPGCGAAPVLLFALEELGRPYALVVRESGHFLSRYGQPGPLLRDGDVEHVGLAACVASLAGERERAHIASFTTTFGSAVRALFANRADAAARAALERALDALTETLGDQKYAFDVPTIADVNALSLRVLPKLGVDASRWPRLEAYRDRVMSRPAWARATARMEELDPETVLGFWLGDAPATSEGALIAKLRRWFQGGEALDAEIAARFSETLERALRGELDGWAATPRGRLALVIVLDQFTRNVFRGDERAYAGDARAQALALDALDGPMHVALGTEERLFLNMPLVHAEDRALQDRAVHEAERLVARSPAELRGVLAMSVEQSTKYRHVIDRFGRFPHRNAILGRTSTPEEEAFLVGWTDRAPPARLRAAS